MEQDKIIAILQQDKSGFVEYLEEVKRKKVKLLNPNVANKVVASAGVIAYIDSLLNRIIQEDTERA